MDKKQYGWWICFACSLMLFCNTGLSTTGFSIYQPYLIRLGGLTNTQASSLILLRNLSGFIGMLCSGKLLQRFEIRRIVTAGMLINGSAFFFYGISRSFFNYCFAALLIGFSYGAAGNIPATILITRWFDRYRGIALGICMASTGLSTIIASPLIMLLMEKHSLQFAFFSEAAFVLCCSIIVYALLRSRPECLHTQPIGIINSESDRSNQKYASKTAGRSLYLYMLAGIFLFGMPGNILYAHISVLYETSGFDAMQVSFLLSIFGAALTIGKIGYGYMSDKIGTYRSSWFLYSFCTIGTLLSCFAWDGSIWIARAAVILMGLGFAVTTVSMPMYAAGISSESDYAITMSRFQSLSTLGALLFGTVPGIIADKTGSYIPAFIAMLFLIIISSVFLQFIFHRIIRTNVIS